MVSLAWAGSGGGGGGTRGWGGGAARGGRGGAGTAGGGVLVRERVRAGVGVPLRGAVRWRLAGTLPPAGSAPLSLRGAVGTAPAVVTVTLPTALSWKVALAGLLIAGGVPFV